MKQGTVRTNRFLGFLVEVTSLLFIYILWLTNSFNLGVAESSSNPPTTSNLTSLATSASLLPMKNSLPNKRRYNAQEGLLQHSDVMNTAKIAKL